MKVRQLLIYTLLLLIGSCVEPYDLKLAQGSKLLVVEGLITDQPGPHSVKLTTTAAFDNTQEGVVKPVTGAQLFITDNLGNEITLTETSPGVYQTAAASQGTVDRSYQLHISTADGVQYESKPELMKSVSPIDSIYWEYQDGTSAQEKGIYVYLDTEDPATSGDYYRWNWRHYERKIFCQQYAITSGNVTGPELGYECCVPCWKIDYCYECVNITSDVYVNGNHISRQPILTAPFDNTSPYYLEIEQYSLSQPAYQFWKLLKEQSNSTGGPFDNPPATVAGNMVNLTNPQGEALGFFGASAVALVPYWIDRSTIVGTPTIAQRPPGAPYPAPCYECEETTVSTSIQPRFWK